MSEWIKTSERMPDDNQMVVIIDSEHGSIYAGATCIYSAPRFILIAGLRAENYDGGAVVELDLEATHWMPLSPPQD